MSPFIYGFNDVSGYDLGYLLKTMTSVPLPPVDTEFFELLTTYFPSVYGMLLLPFNN